MSDQQSIRVINTTMELEDIAGQWILDEAHRAWCLEDVLYTPRAKVPQYQRLSIFVPEEYMCAPGVIDPKGTRGGFTARTAPVILQNNSAGYRQMMHTRIGEMRDRSGDSLAAGFVFVTCGNRGSESTDAQGRLCGKSPANLVDLKTVIRFLRHNRESLPGNLDRIVSTGWSAGGAMSALLAVTGDHKDFLPYLEENGAFMDESDAVYAAQIYCPIVDLDHADLAYEWMFRADRVCEESHAGPAEEMTPFKEALSAVLAKEYVAYFNSLQLVDPAGGGPLTFGEDGRSGSAYDWLMKLLNESATIFLERLTAGGLDLHCSVEDYIAGRYTFKRRSMRRRPGENPSLAAFEPVMQEFPGDEKAGWLSWDGQRARIKDLDTYLLHHRRRMKPCTSFDTLPGNSGENRVFGGVTEETDYQHFDTFLPEALEQLRNDFPKEYAEYAPAFAGVCRDEQQMERKCLYNPYGYAMRSGESVCARHARIRVGAQDADTSFSISMGLALIMAQNGFSVDYALVWDKPHCDADYEGEFTDWVRSIMC